MKFFMDHMGSRDWAVRRRIIILSLLWCAALVTYLAIWGRPIALSDTVAMNLILLFGGIVGSYVFGAVWESNAKVKAESRFDDPYGAPYSATAEPYIPPAEPFDPADRGMR